MVCLTTLGPNSTLITITPLSGGSAFDITPWSCRGATQTLEPISSIAGGGSILGTQIVRDVWGNLLDWTNPNFQKYQSVISARDTMTPALDGAFYGALVQVDCAVELSYLSGGTPRRAVVSGSERSEGGFTFYRPSLLMRVVGIKSSFSEYTATYSWEITLQETA